MPATITLQSVLRTLSRLRKVARVPAEDLANALSSHLKAQHLIEVANHLERVGAHMYAKQSGKCATCGGPLDAKISGDREMQLRWVRADACYCSAACKQKAYRQRVTARPSARRSEGVTRDGSAAAGGSVAVTTAAHSPSR